MKCKLCDKFFNTDNSFSFLFYFPNICPTCEERYKPNLRKEIVPIDNGEIHYYYLYDLSLNLSQRLFLEKHMYLIYKEILVQQSNYDLIIQVDDFLLKEMAVFWYLIKPFKNIYFFSLQYIDISNWKFLE